MCIDCPYIHENNLCELTSWPLHLFNWCDPDQRGTSIDWSDNNSCLREQWEEYAQKSLNKYAVMISFWSLDRLCYCWMLVSDTHVILWHHAFVLRTKGFQYDTHAQVRVQINVETTELIYQSCCSSTPPAFFPHYPLSHPQGQSENKLFGEIGFNAEMSDICYGC